MSRARISTTTSSVHRLHEVLGATIATETPNAQTSCWKVTAQFIQNKYRAISQLYWQGELIVNLVEETNVYKTDDLLNNTSEMMKAIQDWQTETELTMVVNHTLFDQPKSKSDSIRADNIRHETWKVLQQWVQNTWVPVNSSPAPGFRR